ncbi:MAG TPA: MBL fold metallo-hydrolase [Anaerolineae bacterium]
MRSILMLLMFTLFLIAGVSPAAAVLTGTPTHQNTNSLDAIPQQQDLQVLTPLEKALAGVGGEEALQGLTALSIEASGIRWVLDEGFVSGGPAGMVGPYTLQVAYDIEGDNLRLDHTRESLGQERQVSEIIAGDLGYVEGQDANFGPPDKNMTSDRWASTRKQQRLLNPHLILQDILANPDIATEGGEQLLDGSVHHLLVVEDATAPLTLYINAGTGQIAKLATMESDPLRRDVSVEVFYYSWQPVGSDGLFFPAEIYAAHDGEIVLKEIRTAIEVNPTLDSDLFEFPAGAEPVFDEDLAVWGEQNQQYIQMFAALGFPRDGVQPNVIADEIAPGIFHLTGGSHHSLAIEQDDGIVIAEAPLDETRSEAIIAWVESNFPGKPITHVIATHHHTDHSGGLRSLVAEGATAALHEAAVPFFEEVFLASSTIRPDALALDPVAAAIDTVPADGSLTIPDDTHPVEVYPLDQTHAEDAVLIYVADEDGGVVFISDLYSPAPGADPGAGGMLIHDAITSLGLEVSTIAGGHGATIDFTEFEELLGQ